uniref:Transposase-associated domain-containing protein n=1 Tax=Triticum urartu TaxID=4572 RepID=A0A8R7TUQ9_TRIUA
MADQSARGDHSGAPRNVDVDRSWMYKERRGKLISDAWQHGVDNFLDHAFSLPDAAVDGESHCPCSNCFCRHKCTRDVMTRHLCSNGFMLGYERWTSHGESDVPENVEHDNVGGGDRMNDMLVDAIVAEGVSKGDEPTKAAKKFYEMLMEADKPLHEKTTQSRLSIVGRLMTIKTQHNLSEACYDEMMTLIHDIVGDDAAKDLPANFHRSKKLVHSLAMPYVKIHACPNNCMIYYKENENKEKCTICKEPRYEETTAGNKSTKIPRKVLCYLPITPRLQRLYMSQSTAKHMDYHARPRDSDEVMVHPSHGEAWKEFNKEFKKFAEDGRNIRLCLATDGFTPFGIKAASYSCWPVFVVPYNLPPEMCMKQSNLILALVIPGLDHPGKNLNIFMQPLVDELDDLWRNGVETYDSYRKQNFTLKAALLWTIHDIPAYGLVACWSTHGKLACPICGSDIKAFSLKNGRKPCWFDCHRRFLPINHACRRSVKCFRKKKTVLNPPPKPLSGEEVYEQLKSLVHDKTGKSKFEGFGKEHNWIAISGLWQLEYFQKLMLRHNIDVMHNEKNVSEAILNTCLDIPKKTKDNNKARLDVALYCDRPKLHLKKNSKGVWKKPRAKYCVSKDDKMTILKWFKEVKFSDGVAANLSKTVNLQQKNLLG